MLRKDVFFMSQEIKSFSQYIEVQCYSAETKKAYSFHIEKFLLICKKNNTEPSQKIIMPYLNYLLKKHNYNPSSLNIAKYALIYYFTNVLNQTLTVKIPKIKRSKSLPKPENRQIIKKLIENTSNFKHRMLIEVLYSTGVRLAEVIRIRWNDIDFGNGIVRINMGKGKKDRFSKLSEQALIHLTDYRKVREVTNKINPYVFDSEQRKDYHISKKTVQKVLEKACKKAKLGRNISPHKLRHSFGTHMVESGYSTRIIQDMMGHSSSKTTEQYTKVAKSTIIQVKSPLDTLEEGIENEIRFNYDNKQLNRKNYRQSPVKRNSENHNC